MEVFRELKHAASFLEGGTVATIGSYDGVHLGHAQILDRLAAEARASSLKSLLITFSPHPQQVISPKRAPKLLSTTPEKIKLVARHNLDAMFLINFDEKMSRVSARDFLGQYLLGGFKLRHLVIGYNHAFGHQREGDAEFLKQESTHRDFKLTLIEPVICRGEPVHSSRIRKVILHGDYDLSLELLGHDYQITGKVVHGKGLGSSLGFPTINIKTPPEKLIPPSGVYAAYVLIDGDRREGMMYIGESDQDYALEVNLFDFDRNLYGQEVVVAPLRFVRRSLRFAHQHELVEQIRADEKRIREMFK
ncbi:MAG: bifunctional riboflavin kinase/FAD synthetase [bacterium]